MKSKILLFIINIGLILIVSVAFSLKLHTLESKVTVLEGKVNSLDDKINELNNQLTNPKIKLIPIKH